MKTLVVLVLSLVFTEMAIAAPAASPFEKHQIVPDVIDVSPEATVQVSNPVFLVTMVSR